MGKAHHRDGEEIVIGDFEKIVSDAYVRGWNEGVEAMAKEAANHCWDHENWKKCMALADALKKPAAEERKD